MKRREFITLVGGAAAWPLAARAQHERTRHVGMITAGSDENDPDAQANRLAFVHAMHQLGWVEGRNLRIDYFWAAASPMRFANTRQTWPRSRLTWLCLPARPHWGSCFARHGRCLSSSSMSPTPSAAGSLIPCRGPAATPPDFMQFEYSLSGKWLEVLKQIAPGTKRAAVLRDADVPSGIGQFAVIQSVAPSVGVEVKPINMRDAAEMEDAIATFARSSTGGLLVTSSALALHHRERIIALAAHHKMPAVYYRRYFITSGGLISYGPDLADQYRRAAGYVDRILKGERPADLPVQAPTKYEMVINLKTAKALGLNVPPTLLARADEVIE